MINGRDRALLADLEGVPAAIRNRVVLFRILVVLAGQLRARMDRRYRGAGITTQQAAVLGLVRSAASPLKQSDVARLLGVTQQNVRQLVDALVRKGLLEVRSQPGDRRMKRLVATRRVAGLFARRNTGDFAAIAGWFRLLDDVEVELVATHLGAVLTGMLPPEGREAPLPPVANPSRATAGPVTSRRARPGSRSAPGRTGP